MNFCFPPRCLISVQITGTKVFTSLAAIPNSAALDILLLQVGWQAGCARTHPKSCGSPLGNQHIAALTGAAGIPSAFQGDQDKLPVASAPTQQSSRPWQMAQRLGTTAALRTTLPFQQPVIHFEDWLVHDRKIWKSLSRLNFCASIANLLCQESCWVRAVLHCKVPFFGVKLRDYEAEGIIHHYWL